MSVPRLSHINGGRWIAEGEVNTIKETIMIRVILPPQGYKKKDIL
jgi:hypothetical protein